MRNLNILRGFLFYHYGSSYFISFVMRIFFFLFFFHLYFTILLLLLSLVGIFLSAGGHPPLGNVYIFMMKHIPGFASFRSAYYKFMPTVYLSFAILIATAVYYLLNKFSSKAKFCGGVILIFLTLLYHY